VVFEPVGEHSSMHLITDGTPTTVHAGQTRRLNVAMSMGGSDPDILRIRWTENGENKEHDFHGLHMRGVEQPRLHDLLQAVERRLPVGRGRLHRSDRHPADEQPVPHHVQGPGGRRERARLTDPTTTGTGRAPADGQRVLADVQPGDPLEQHLHRDHFLPDDGRWGVARRVLCQDTDPRARSSNQRHPRTPRQTPQRACPHQCVSASPDDQSILVRKGNDQDRKPSHLVHPGRSWWDRAS
jgi:hypothetical protein